MPRSAKPGKGARGARGLLSLNQDIADRIVGEYARCRELSMAAWKRLDAGQRDALTRYRAAGFEEINGLLRGAGESKSKSKSKSNSRSGGDDAHTLDWSAVLNWSKPATHWIMTPGTPGWGPDAGDCPLYETPIGSLGRLVERARAAISAAVVSLDGVFSAKTTPALPAPLTLFRGADAEAVAACAVGESVPQPAFLSTSLSPTSARNFMGDLKATGDAKKKILLVVRVPAGVPFVLFDGITGGANDRSNEMEILFPRGASLRKLSAGRETDDPDLHYRTAADALKGEKGRSRRMVVVDCELVPPPAGPPPPVPAHPPGSPAVKLYPSVLEEGRSTACGYSVAARRVF